jgi:hypothetical protein
MPAVRPMGNGVSPRLFSSTQTPSISPRTPSIFVKAKYLVVDTPREKEICCRAKYQKLPYPTF